MIASHMVSTSLLDLLFELLSFILLKDLLISLAYPVDCQQFLFEPFLDSLVSASSKQCKSIPQNRSFCVVIGGAGTKVADKTLNLSLGTTPKNTLVNWAFGVSLWTGTVLKENSNGFVFLVCWPVNTRIFIPKL